MAVNVGIAFKVAVGANSVDIAILAELGTVEVGVADVEVVGGEIWPC